jgi:hypothetical protein
MRAIIARRCIRAIPFLIPRIACAPMAQRPWPGAQKVFRRFQFEFEGLTPDEQIALAKGSRSEIDRLLGVKGQ